MPASADSDLVRGRRRAVPLHLLTVAARPIGPKVPARCAGLYARPTSLGHDVPDQDSRLTEVPRGGRFIAPNVRNCTSELDEAPRQVATSARLPIMAGPRWP